MACQASGPFARESGLHGLTMPILYVMAAPRRVRPAVPAAALFDPSSSSRDYDPQSLIGSLRGLMALASQTENCARIALSASIEMDGAAINVAAVRGTCVAEIPPFTPAEGRALDIARKACAGAGSRSLATAPIVVAGICVGATC